jgi:hypothetical protein
VSGFGFLIISWNPARCVAFDHRRLGPLHVNDFGTAKRCSLRRSSSEKNLSGGG